MYEDDINGSDEPAGSDSEISSGSAEEGSTAFRQDPQSGSSGTASEGGSSEATGQGAVSGASERSATEPLQVPTSQVGESGTASQAAAAGSADGKNQPASSVDWQFGSPTQAASSSSGGASTVQSQQQGQRTYASQAPGQNQQGTAQAYPQPAQGQSAYSSSAPTQPQQGQASYSSSAPRQSQQGQTQYSTSSASQGTQPSQGQPGYHGNGSQYAGQQGNAAGGQQRQTAYSTSGASRPNQAGNADFSAGQHSQQGQQPYQGYQPNVSGSDSRQDQRYYQQPAQERPAYYTDNVYSGTSRPASAGGSRQSSSYQPSGSGSYAGQPGQGQPAQGQPGQASQAYTTPAYSAEQQAQQASGKDGKKGRKRKERKERKEKSTSSGVKSFVWGIVGIVAGAAIVLAALGISGNLGGGTEEASSSSETTTTSNGTITINATSEDATTAQAVAAKVLPSVVSIDVYEESASYSFGDMMGSSDSDETEETQTATGSGVIISEDGYIVTNYHVVAEGTIYIVYFDDDTSAEATIVGYDDSSDLAVLKVEKDGLTAIDVGDSSEVAVGDWVMTAGSPFGLTKSVSSGIVSALYRNETLENSYGSSFYVNMIQVDAGVNPGNSGGALVNAEGELIGICTLTASYSGDFSGVGFAIPSNYVMNIADSIIENGYAEHPYIGVSVGTVDASTQQYYNTTAEYGAYVASVVSGGPAEEAGIQQGDVIVSMDGEDITTSSELIIDVRSKEIGDTVEIGVIRDGEELTFEVTLASDSESVDSES